MYNIQGKNDTNEDIAFYIDKVTAIYGNTDSNIWTNELKNGNNDLDLTNLNIGDVLNFNVNISKSEDMTDPISIIIAAYDGEGNLMKVGLQKIDASETGEISKTASVTVDDIYDQCMIYKVVGFVWSTDTQKPLADTAVALFE